MQAGRGVFGVVAVILLLAGIGALLVVETPASTVSAVDMVADNPALVPDDDDDVVEAPDDEDDDPAPSDQRVPADLPPDLPTAIPFEVAVSADAVRAAIATGTQDDSRPPARPAADTDDTAGGEPTG